MDGGCQRRFEDSLSELLDFQRPSRWNSFPLVNGGWFDAKRLGERGSAAKVLDDLRKVVSVHGLIVSQLTFNVNLLTVTPMGMACKMSYMNIGLRIKQARLARKPKMTQQQLAAAVDVSRPAVTQWETSETKTLEGENLVRVAHALGVTTEWLLYGTGPGPGEPLQPKTADAANDQQGGLSQRALLMAQVFDQLCPEQQNALQTLLHAFTQSNPHQPKLKSGSHDG